MSHASRKVPASRLNILPAEETFPNQVKFARIHILFIKLESSTSGLKNNPHFFSVFFKNTDRSSDPLVGCVPCVPDVWPEGQRKRQSAACSKVEQLGHPRRCCGENHRIGATQQASQRLGLEKVVNYFVDHS